MSSIKANSTKQLDSFAHRLLEWYAKHARTMPWRIPPADHAQGVRADPYHIWLSEVMLQQTQVATVREYFLKFTSTWPTLSDLAASDLEDVLKAWAGLGYYSRARNLKKCANSLVAEHKERFPETFEGLKKLPGIGDYTASAIASIAFDQPVPVLDGNVERVMSRHYRIETPFPQAKVETKELLETVLDPEKPGEFAQAMMDLGATICTPKKPACALCPINEDCAAFKYGDTDRFPRKMPKPEKPTRKGAAFIIQNPAGDVFLCKRGDIGLLAGMTQVPTNDWTAKADGKTGPEALPFDGNWKNVGIARHTFTHFHLELEVWHIVVTEKPQMEGWWCKADDLVGEALPKVMHKAIGRIR